MCIVGDDAKAGVGGILLHDAAERHLCGGSHGICFVENDEFVVAEDLEVPRFRRGREDLFGALEGTNPSVMQRNERALVFQWDNVVLAKVLICSRTTSIPLSSLALSSRTICRMFLLP